MLTDSALVIRTQAVDAIEALRPPGSESALAAATLDPRNHHGGKALWVPQKALKALVRMGARDQAWALLPLLKNRQDLDLIRQTLSALATLRPDEARWVLSKTAPNASLAAVAGTWQQAAERFR
jgi:hypothetical protein